MSDWEALLEGREWLEALPEGREWLGGPLGQPGVVGRPSWRVRRTSRRAGSDQKAIPKDRDWSRGPP